MRRLIINALLYCSGLFFPFSLTAQTTEIRLEELDIQDAPPLATIDCIYEDSRGFLWLGCYSGLYMFDGYSLTPFYYNPNDTLTISDNKIKKLLEDRHGNIWVATQMGLNYFDTRKKTFQHYNNKEKNGIGDVEIYDLKQDEQGRIWVAAADGLYQKEPGSRLFKKRFPAERDTALVPSVHAIELTAQGIYFCSPPGLFHLDVVSGKAVAILSKKTLYARAPTEYISTQQDHSGHIWIGTGLGLFSYQPLSDNGIIAHPAFYRQPVSFVGKENAQYEMWLGTGTGVSVLNTQTGECRKNIPLQKNGERIDAESFAQICNSASGIVWLSSAMRRLYKVDNRKLRFGHVPIQLLEDLKSVARKLFELYEYSPGILLIPQKNGPSLLNIYTRKATPFPHQPPYNIAGWKDGLTCFLEEKDGLLWMGTGGGLFLFDKNKRRFINPEDWSRDFTKLRGLAIRKIHRDKKNNLWVATWVDGIFKINLSTMAVVQYNSSKGKEAEKIAYTRTVFETRNGDIWVGTRGGLLKYSEPGDTFQVYKKMKDNLESMSENTAFCIYEDAEGSIWCGTYGGGLNKLDVQSGKFKHYTTADGLLNNNVFSLLPDKKDKLWMLGYNGISKFNPATDSFQVYTQQQGLLNKEYDGFLYGRSRDSKLLFFCGKNGIDYFDPDSIGVSNFNPRVWITDFKLFNESVPIAGSSRDTGGFALPEDISHTGHLMLRYDQNVITFDYVALDFSSPRTIQYAYQLIGFDKDWQKVGAKRSVTFTNLDPGDYTFQVKATNSDGIWGDKIATLHITVLTPWWRTGWFLTLTFLSFAALVIAFYQYRIGQIRERESIRANLNRRIAEAKMEALRSQMNPHFIFNCLSSLKSYVEKNETEKASVHISKFSRLLRQVLDQAKSDDIPLTEELDTLQRYVELEQMRYKNFDFQVDIHPGVPVHEIKLPPLIIQPYVENAIWHGLQYKTKDKGKLLLQVGMLEEECRIIVEDNGIGRVASMDHKKKSLNIHPSHGMNVTAERTALFNLKHQNNARIDIIDLSDTEGKPTGTRVVLTFKPFL